MRLYESKLRKIVREIIIETNKTPNRAPTGNITAIKKALGDAALEAAIDAMIGPVGSIYSGAKKAADKRSQDKVAKEFPSIPVAEILSICKNFPVELKNYYNKNKVPDVIEVFNYLLNEYGVNYELVQKQATNQEEISDTAGDIENYAGMFEPVKFNV